MSKSLAASKQLMQTYLSELLTEEVEEKKIIPVKEKQPQPLDKLLSNATFPQISDAENSQSLTSAKAESKKTLERKPVIEPVTSKVTVEPSKEQVEAKLRAPVIEPVDVNKIEIKTRKSAGGFDSIKQRNYRQGDFQAMFFDVAGLLVAVPLIELGGIHNNDKTTSLMGKPDWFKGVMLHRDEKVNVVDTARWVMPDKCNETLVAALDYKYIIMLSDSSWGLTAEKLVDTVTLKQEDVKWLDTPNKRPWLAGLVKNRMCALLDVESLIKLLEKGANITQD